MGVTSEGGGEKWQVKRKKGVYNLFSATRNNTFTSSVLTIDTIFGEKTKRELKKKHIRCDKRLLAGALKSLLLDTAFPDTVFVQKCLHFYTNNSVHQTGC